MDRYGRRPPDRPNVLLVSMIDGTPTPARHRQSLTARGYQVLQASDATTALDMARTSLPRAIYLMAERNGSERSSFLQALRRDDTTRHIPVIVLPLTGDRALERFGLTSVNRERW
jgi:DNA-binding response OmpR family regulator